MMLNWSGWCYNILIEPYIRLTLPHPCAWRYDGVMGGIYTNKVLAYITWDTKLLVFHQPDFPEAGLQVPGGTIEPGEFPDHAVMREAQEETGLTSLTLMRKLGVATVDISAHHDEVQERHIYHLKIDGRAPSVWEHMENDPSVGGAPIRFQFRWEPLDGTDLGLAAQQGMLLHMLS